MNKTQHKQIIQNFLNCCIMETQGKPVNHDDLEKLLEFYFADEDETFCPDLSCHQNGAHSPLI